MLTKTALSLALTVALNSSPVILADYIVLDLSPGDATCAQDNTEASFMVQVCNITASTYNKHTSKNIIIYIYMEMILYHIFLASPELLFHFPLSFSLLRLTTA